MPELRIDRHFDAPPERVFTFVTEESGLLAWWVPEGMTARDPRLDFTRPGPWSMIVTGPGMGDTTMRGEVTDVDPPHSVELTFVVAYAGGGAPMESIVRFELEPDGTGTRFTIVQSGISEEMVVMGMKRGWPTTLDRLGRALAAG